MTDQKKPKQDLSWAVAFATAILGAVHMLTFVWMAGFVYRDNIRGYVPAGITGLMILAVATLALILYLAVAGRRKGKALDYLPVGCLGALLGIFAASIYCGILLKILGYSLRKDIGISATGAILFIAVAVMSHRKFLNKKADNKRVEATGETPSPHP